MLNKIIAVASGIIIGVSAIVPIVAQATNIPVTEQKSEVKDDKKAAIAAEIFKVLDDQQKGKLKTALEQGAEIREVLPTLGLSQQQKQQIMQIMRSARGN